MSHVLLIEPDRKLAKIYMAALKIAGFSVQTCATAQTAIFCADETKPDVVVAELQLVGHSGIEFLYEFRSYKDWQNIPVVITSHVPARDLSGSWEVLRDELGVATHIYKPQMKLKELVAAVQGFSALTK